MSFPIQSILFRGSYLLAIVFFVIFLRKLVGLRVLGIIFWGGILSLFVRSRWIEPQQVKIEEHMIETGFSKNVVLISDLHVGVYKGRGYLEKVVRKINELDTIDAVLIAGDITYNPIKKDVETLTVLFQPLQEIDVPVFAVLGNHDVERPGPELRNELVKALNINDVIFLHNDIYQLGEVKLVGLGPHFSQEDDVSILEGVTEQENVIVLTHNPDTTSKYGTSLVDISLVGHTHCGQIRIPYIQEYIRPYFYPVEGDFDCGRYPERKLFITQGLGEVLLPLRFMNPPAIDVLRLR